MRHDPWRRPASPDQLRALYEAKVLAAPAAERALEIATGSPPPALWESVLRRGLLIIGSALFLAGVIFFFAWNWAALGRFEKLGIIAAAMVLAATVGWSRSPTLVGQVALFAACILEGALLAVYGQAYQTGADPYELFTAWMLLILPWVIAARTPAFFALQLALGNVALSLFWTQVLDTWNQRELWLLPLLAAPNLVAMVAWELFSNRLGETGRGRWFPRTVGTWALLLLVWASLSAIVRGPATGFGAATILLLVTAVAWLTVVFARGERQDLFLVAMAWSSAAIVADGLIGRALFSGLNLDIGGFFLMGVIVLAEVAAFVSALRALGRDGVAEAA